MGLLGLWAPLAFPFDELQRKPGTTRALQAWNRLDPGEFRTPMPLLVGYRAESTLCGVSTVESLVQSL